MQISEIASLSDEDRSWRPRTAENEVHCSHDDQTVMENLCVSQQASAKEVAAWHGQVKAIRACLGHGCARDGIPRQMRTEELEQKRIHICWQLLLWCELAGNKFLFSIVTGNENGILNCNY
jgi:hypothetical protein